MQLNPHHLELDNNTLLPISVCVYKCWFWCFLGRVVGHGSTKKAIIQDARASSRSNHISTGKLLNALIRVRSFIVHLSRPPHLIMRPRSGDLWCIAREMKTYIMYIQRKHNISKDVYFFLITSMDLRLDPSPNTYSSGVNGSLTHFDHLHIRHIIYMI